MRDVSATKKFSPAAVLLAALALLLLPALSANAATLKFGDDAPLFVLKDLQGKDFALKDLVGPARRSQGAGVFLVFFTTWCPSCRKELPLINAMNAELARRGITVVLIGYQEYREDIAAFLKKLGVGSVTAIADLSGRAGKRYNLRILPTIYAVTAAGKVVAVTLGESRDLQGDLRRMADRLTAH